MPDLDAGLAFHRDALGHQLLWRNDDLDQAGLATPESTSEVVTTEMPSQPNWKVDSASRAAETFAANGHRRDPTGEADRHVPG